LDVSYVRPSVRRMRFVLLIRRTRLLYTYTVYNNKLVAAGKTDNVQSPFISQRRVRRRLLIYNVTSSAPVIPSSSSSSAESRLYDRVRSLPFVGIMWAPRVSKMSKSFERKSIGIILQEILLTYRECDGGISPDIEHVQLYSYAVHRIRVFIFKKNPTTHKRTVITFVRMSTRRE